MKRQFTPVKPCTRASETITRLIPLRHGFTSCERPLIESVDGPWILTRLRRPRTWWRCRKLTGGVWSLHLRGFGLGPGSCGVLGVVGVVGVCGFSGCFGPSPKHFENSDVLPPLLMGSSASLAATSDCGTVVAVAVTK